MGFSYTSFRSIPSSLVPPLHKVNNVQITHKCVRVSVVYYLHGITHTRGHPLHIIQLLPGPITSSYSLWRRFLCLFIPYEKNKQRDVSYRNGNQKLPECRQLSPVAGPLYRFGELTEICWTEVDSETRSLCRN